MSDTLYIQTEQNVEVHHPHVYLQDIAKLSCSNAKILNRLRVMPVANLDPDKPGRYVICAMDLIKDIQQKRNRTWTSPTLESLPSSSLIRRKAASMLFSDGAR